MLRFGSKKEQEIKQMRKISFWLTTVANLIMLILVIIGIVKVSKEFGFNINEYVAYQATNIWGSIWFGITIAVAAISVIMLIVDYYIESDTLQRVLMSIALALPVVLFGVGLIFFLFNGRLVGSILIIVSLAVCLWPIITLIVSDDHRAKFIYLIISSIWLFGGIYTIVGILALIVLGIVIAVMGIFLGGDGGVEVYDKFGNFMGKMYRD